MSGLRFAILALGVCAFFLTIDVALGRAASDFAWRIRGANMEPTLSVGDVVRVRGDERSCRPVNPAVGDVVVYRHPSAKAPSGYLTSRVVAGPGQRVQLRNGRLLIDGVEVPSAFGPMRNVFGRNVQSVRETLPNGVSFETEDYGPFGDEYDEDARFPWDNTNEVTVPAGTWFLLGDSRDNSRDSREYGAIPAGDICGVAVKVARSRDPMRRGTKP